MVELVALVDAAKAGDEARVRELIADDPGLAVQRLPTGESPLMAALYRGHRTVIDALVDLGADVDVFAAAATGRLPQLAGAIARPGAATAYSYDGWTPLHLAAFFGQLDAARILVAAGVDVLAVSRNSVRNTALHAATAGKHQTVALMLLKHGADPTAVDADGYTPLRIATENQLAEVVQAISSRPD